MGWFGRNRSRAAINLLQGRWRCAECEVEHQGLMDLAAYAPDPWPGAEEREPNSALRFDGNFLSEDFCILDGRHFMIRAVLEIPVNGIAEKFGFGCWTTLSRENFEKYVGGFDEGNYGGEGPWGGWLCNRLFDYIGQKPEAVWVFPQSNRQRPTLTIQYTGHPLAIDQNEGISPDRMIEILHFYGHGPAQV